MLEEYSCTKQHFILIIKSIGLWVNEELCLYNQVFYTRRSHVMVDSLTSYSSYIISDNNLTTHFTILLLSCSFFFFCMISKLLFSSFVIFYLHWVVSCSTLVFADFKRTRWNHEIYTGFVFGGISSISLQNAQSESYSWTSCFKRNSRGKTHSCVDSPTNDNAAL